MDMELLLFPMAIASFLATLFLTSHIAKQVHGKYWKMPVILVSWVVGGIVAFSTFVSIDFLPVETLDPMVVLGLKCILPIIISTIAFMLIIRLDFLGALTVNFAGLCFGLIFSVVVIIVSGDSLEKAVTSSNIALQTARLNAVSMITGKPVDQEALAKLEPVEVEIYEEEIEPVYTTNDFLLPSAQKALEAQKEVVYTHASYHTISLSSARRVVGKQIRATWKTGKVSIGQLASVQGGDLIVNLRREEGTAQVPIPRSSLQKLEVYR